MSATLPARKFLLPVTLAVIAGCCPALAADNPGRTDDERPLVAEPIEQADTTHETVTRAVETVAKSLDRFFGDERAFEEDNNSSLQIRGDVITDQRDGVDFDGRVKAKLVLPGTKRRLRLIVESDAREAGIDDTQDDALRSTDNASDYVVGLESEILAGDWQLRPSLGLKMDLPPDPYARLRAIRYWGLGKWLARVSTTAAWFRSDGTSVAGDLDLDRQLGDTTLFRSASGVRWESDDSVTSVTQTFSIFDRLASRARVAYDVGATFDNDPDWRTNEYFVRLRYRRLVYKNWAYLELQPRIGWPDEYDYQTNLSLLARLEVTFGKSYQ